MQKHTGYAFGHGALGSLYRQNAVSSQDPAEATKTAAPKRCRHPTVRKVTIETEADKHGKSCSRIDWTGCDLVEQVPGKVSGQPIVRRTRIMPGPVVRSFDRGENIEQIREHWPSLSVDQIKGLVAFAHIQRGQRVP